MSRQHLKTIKLAGFEEIICDYCEEQIGILNRVEGEKIPESWKSINSGRHHCGDCARRKDAAYDAYVDPKRMHHLI